MGSCKNLTAFICLRNLNFGRIVGYWVAISLCLSLGSYGSEVEHFLGKEEVAGSSPAMSSTDFREKIKHKFELQISLRRKRWQKKNFHVTSHT